jgi:hypothetical protein
MGFAVEVATNCRSDPAKVGRMSGYGISLAELVQGLASMNPPITCTTCLHFQPDPLNPEAGMGRCMHPARHGYKHALEPHRCRDHELQECEDENLNSK